MRKRLLQVLLLICGFGVLTSTALADDHASCIERKLMTEAYVSDAARFVGVARGAIQQNIKDANYYRAVALYSSSDPEKAVQTIEEAIQAKSLTAPEARQTLQRWIEGASKRGSSPKEVASLHETLHRFDAAEAHRTGAVKSVISAKPVEPAHREADRGAVLVAAKRAESRSVAEEFGVKGTNTWESAIRDHLAKGSPAAQLVSQINRYVDAAVSSGDVNGAEKALAFAEKNRLVSPAILVEGLVQAVQHAAAAHSEAEILRLRSYRQLLSTVRAEHFEYLIEHDEALLDRADQVYDMTELKPAEENLANRVYHDSQQIKPAAP